MGDGEIVKDTRVKGNGKEGRSKPNLLALLGVMAVDFELKN